jgi:hypothetical protein
MDRSLKFGTLFVLLVSCVLICGQGEGGAGCGFMSNAPDPLAPLVEEPDPLAPLIEDPDPLAPLVPDTPTDPRWPRGLCATWSGKLSGTRLHNSTIETGCPWDDGTIDFERTVKQEQHVSDFQLTFKDLWAAARTARERARSGPPAR